MGEQDEWFDEATRRQIDAGAVEVITETQLWQRLGLVDVAARRPPAVHAGHAGRVAEGAGGGDSPLAAAGIDRAGARGAAAAVLRFSGGGHRPAAGRTAGGGRFAPRHRAEAGGLRPLFARRGPAAGAAFGDRARQGDSAAPGGRPDRAGRAVAVRFRRLAGRADAGRVSSSADGRLATCSTDAGRAHLGRSDVPPGRRA